MMHLHPGAGEVVAIVHIEVAAVDVQEGADSEVLNAKA